MKYQLTILLFSYLFVSCKTQENVLVKENPPLVLTKAASEVSVLTATLNGEVTEEGFTAVTERGFVYSDLNTNPSVSDKKIQSGFGKGEYSVKVDNLNANTKYYYKAYSTNSKGTSYGVVQSFLTADYLIPKVKTDVALNIAYFSVDLGGSVIEDGGLKVTERGFTFGLKPNPSILDNKVLSGEGLGIFKISLKNLTNNSKYYVRAYAINSKGIGYGNEETFNTLDASKGFRDITTKVVEVKSKTGRIWMDRNLGATQVETSIYNVDGYYVSGSNFNSFGDLYQWGRGADGHQLRTSGTTSTISSEDQPNHGLFILPEDYKVNSISNWRNPQNINLWQGVNGINNPCPVGYRLPTDKEWEEERLSWISNNGFGAFSSPLKLPLAGRRNDNDYNSFGYYWSSTVSGNVSSSLKFSISGNGSGMSNYKRVEGYSVRCIKD
jgi:uncharacterized protein (TIGR02145 family)